MMQQHIGETAGGGPNIQAHASLRRQREMGQCVRQLHAAARHPGMLLPAHLHRSVERHGLTRLVDPLLAAKHLAGQDQRLGPRPAFGEAAVDQQLVRPLLRRRAHNG
jgi:hypothetical protein